MAFDYATLGVGLAGLIIVAGVLLMKKTRETRFSAVIPLLLLGIILGPVTGLFDPTKYLTLISSMVTLVLVIVLFDAGYDLSISKLKQYAVPALIMTSLGVFLTGGFVWLLGYFLFNLSWELSLLLAALVISTDLTIVSPVLKSMGVKEAQEEIMGLESALNSVIAAIAAIVAVSFMQLTEFGVGSVLKTFLYNIFVGASLGLILGYLIVVVVAHMKLSEKPHLISIGAVFLVYALTNLVGASGIIAALLVGFVFRNSKHELPRVIKTYSGDLELLLVVFVYVILGTFLNFGIFTSLKGILFSLVFLAVVLLARYLTDRAFTLKYKEFNPGLVFFSGPRGILTAVLVLTYAAHFPAELKVIGLVFLVVIVTTVLSAFVPFAMKRRAAPAVAKAKK